MKLNLSTEPAALVGILIGAIQAALSATDSSGMETVEYIQLGALAVAILVIRALVFAASSVDDVVAFIVRIAKDKTGVDISEDI